jgi:Ca2+-binding RTX toxin-like protein
MLATVAGAFGLLLTIGVGNAAAFSCTYPAGDGNDVLLVLNNETATLSKGNLSRILVNGNQCGTATASNTETVFVVASNGGTGSHLVIDEGGGRFEPGVDGTTTTVESEVNGLHEIEFVLIDADDGVEATTLDSLTILGNAAADEIDVGEGDNTVAQSADDAEGPFSTGPTEYSDVTQDEVGFINLNGDDDADVFGGEDEELGALLPEGGLAVLGRAGNDTISGKGHNGTGGPVTSIGLILDGGDGDDSLQGGEDDDVLSGGPGNDTIDGDLDSISDGSETFEDFCEAFIDEESGQAEADQGGDVVDYSGSAGPITLDLDPNEGHPGSATGDGTDTIQNVEGVIGSTGSDTLSGDDARNVIAGGPGDDTIAGDAGDDCLLGNDGNDTFDENEGTSVAQGGSGTDNGSDLMLGQQGLDDAITYSARTTRVNVYLEPLLGGVDDLIFGCFDDALNRSALGTVSGIWYDGADLDGDGFSSDDEGDCVFLDTENAIGGSGNDLMSGAFVNNRADNEFTGNAGNDLMDGGAGNDTFHEGSAANGADDMDGGTGSDTCDYSARTNPVSVNLDSADNDGEAGEGDNCGGVVDLFDIQVQNRAPQGGIGEGDPEAAQDVENVLGGSGNDVLTGDNEANVLVGNAGNDSLAGNGGTDVLQGGDGDDVLDGGAGNDALDGGAGTDVVDFGSSTSGVVVNLATGVASGAGNDTVTGAENVSGSSHADTLRGTAGNDVLNGRGGADAIQGLGGDDVVNGGEGADELGGGAGNDRVNGGGGADAVRGGGGNDTLQGGPAADTLYGGGGNDSLSGGAGKDDHRGGPGSDRCTPGAPGLGRGDTAAGCES